ncbi:MAG TPA: YfiR family protein [Cyclobacteriaceae bacterium]|nr:YfiR family protein [Cyclobacteriaceae bacterium]
MGIKSLLILLQCLGALAFVGRAHGQPVNELQIKAVFIYNFTQFIEWPAETFESPQDPFIIGVLGENVFGRFLEEAVADERYQSRPIVVKYFATPKDVGNCQILYVGSLPKPGKVTGEHPVLTIGERQDFMEQNGLLRFYKEGKKIRIEINNQAASDAGLTISSKLLQLATVYQPK